MRVPRVLVVGPAEAGKSTLVRLLCKGSMNLAHLGRTVAMDHGVFDLEGRKTVLIGVPGQERFASVREALAAQGNAALWVHPEGALPDMGTVALLRNSARGLPYSVFINRRRPDPQPTEFFAPTDLPPPRELLVGDPVVDPAFVARLRRAICRLVEGL